MGEQSVSVNIGLSGGVLNYNSEHQYSGAAVYRNRSEVVDKRGTREAATEYLQYLYSDEAQRLEAENYYRPSNEAILQEYADTFDLNINLVTIQDFGGWDEAQEKHFADGGIFDEIYEQQD